MTTATATSTQDVLTAISFNSIVFGIFITGFFILRLKFKRIYEPKSYFDLVPESEKTKSLSPKPWVWLFQLLKKKPDFIIRQTGLDGYLFIRYLFIVSSFSLVGMLTWIILLPVNATKGKGNTGLNQLSISNVGHVNRYYAHVFVSWVFYGGIIFIIYRELYFFSKIRIATMSTPLYSKRLSSRTVIFQCVPAQYLDEEEFFKLFNGVKKVWVARGQRNLSKNVNKRSALVDTLEIALNKLLKKAVNAKIKANKKGEQIEPANELVCYVPQNKWPTIRTKKIIGKKVDLLQYCKEKIPEMNKEIDEMQDTFRSARPMNTIAVEFENQYYAQLAYQSTVYSEPLHCSTKQINIEPQDLFWPNMRIFWWEALARKYLAFALICFVIIIWAIPVAFVGIISNLTYLTNKLPWLKFIYKLPKFLLGLITSLLPSVLLAILMLMLPIFIRTMAKLSGCLTTQSIEHYTQNSYFAFQVVQTFLVVTISSSISAVATQILEDPASALTILSNNLPKASNFFISYTILQGFGVAGGSLFQIVPLILFYVLSFILDNSARKKWARWNGIGYNSWGTVFPIYSMLAVVSLSYAIISPMILLFTCVSFFLMFVTYLNNNNYVVGKAPDAIGMYYPRAIFQLFVGIYLGQLCLIGLFAVSKSWGCIALEAISLGATVFVHLQLNLAFDSLVTVVPNNAMRPLDGESETLSWNSEKHSNKYKKSDSPFLSKEELDKLAYEEHSRDTELAHVPLLIDGDDSIPPNSTNYFLKFLQPWKYITYQSVKEYLPETFFELPDEDPISNEHAYDYPDVTAKCPVIWIPKDPMGLSTTIIDFFKGIVQISDSNATFNEKGNIIFTGSPPSSGIYPIDTTLYPETEKE